MDSVNGTSKSMSFEKKGTFYPNLKVCVRPVRAQNVNREQHQGVAPIAEEGGQSVIDKDPW